MGIKTKLQYVKINSDEAKEILRKIFIEINIYFKKKRSHNNSLPQVNSKRKIDYVQ
jgi:hypothetical protein